MFQIWEINNVVWFSCCKSFQAQILNWCIPTQKKEKKVEYSNGFVLHDSTGAVFNLLCSDKDNILISKIENHFGVQIAEVRSPLWLIWLSIYLYRIIEKIGKDFGNHPEYYMGLLFEQKLEESIKKILSLIPTTWITDSFVAKWWWLWGGNERCWTLLVDRAKWIMDIPASEESWFFKEGQRDRW